LNRKIYGLIFVLLLFAVTGLQMGNLATALVDYQSLPELAIKSTPYVFDGNNIDHHPLMCPYDIEKDQIVLPTPIPTQEIKSELSLAPLIAGVLSISVIGVVVGLFYYHRQRRVS
jgi:hypothetical protein